MLCAIIATLPQHSLFSFNANESISVKRCSDVDDNKSCSFIPLKSQEISSQEKALSPLIPSESPNPAKGQCAYKTSNLLVDCNGMPIDKKLAKEIAAASNLFSSFFMSATENPYNDIERLLPPDSSSPAICSKIDLNEPDDSFIEKKSLLKNIPSQMDIGSLKNKENSNITLSSGQGSVFKQTTSDPQPNDTFIGEKNTSTALVITSSIDKPQSSDKQKSSLQNVRIGSNFDLSKSHIFSENRIVTASTNLSIHDDENKKIAPNDSTSDNGKNNNASENSNSNDNDEEDDEFEEDETDKDDNVIAAENDNASLVQLQSTKAAVQGSRELPKTILINFNNVSVIEYLRFLSRVTGKNFQFNEQDLQFNITIVSEEPMPIEKIVLSLLQELRIHGLNLIENDNSFLIFSNNAVTNISKVVGDNIPPQRPGDAQLVTRLFHLNTLDATNAAQIIRPLVSQAGVVEALKDTNHILITDFTDNVNKIGLLISSMDAPNTTLTIGQYVVRNIPLDAFIGIAQQVIVPIAQGQSVTFIPQASSGSVFIVTTPFLMERVIPILQRIDQTTGMTGVFDFKDLEFSNFHDWVRDVENARARNDAVANGFEGAEGAEAGGAAGGGGGRGPGGRYPGGPEGGAFGHLPGQAAGFGNVDFGSWKLNDNGDWVFTPKLPANVPGSTENPVTSQTPSELIKPPEGYWTEDPQGNWIFKYGPRPNVGSDSQPLLNRDGSIMEPKGRWVLNPQGYWVYQLSSGETLSPKRRTQSTNANPDLPLGYVENSKFYIYKLQFRKGDAVAASIQKIALSLADTVTTNANLIATLNSVQWLEDSNSLVFTGPPEYLARARELVEEMDRPVRQVFIEMLILQTTLDDSLRYEVNWGSRFGGGNVSGSQAFLSGSSLLPGGLDSAGFAVNNGVSSALIPTATSLARGQGYTLGIIGQSIVDKCTGLQFDSLGALVDTLHVVERDNIVMNPKILTEDGVPAEIFVGINTQFRTQSVANDLGSLITSNFEYRDIGTRLTVTPTLGPNDIITLKIEEEVSNVATTTNVQGNSLLSDQSAGPTTTKNSTKTRVHVPNGYFIILSGMMQDDDLRHREQVPCLGGVPYLGALFSETNNRVQKRNLMIFIRPLLIDTEEDVRNITKHQQDVWKIKHRFLPMWKYEVEDNLKFMNVDQCYDCGSHDDYEYLMGVDL